PPSHLPASRGKVQMAQAGDDEAKLATASIALERFVRIGAEEFVAGEPAAIALHFQLAPIVAAAFLDAGDDAGLQPGDGVIGAGFPAQGALLVDDQAGTFAGEQVLLHPADGAVAVADAA